MMKMMLFPQFGKVSGGWGDGDVWGRWGSGDVICEESLPICTEVPPSFRVVFLEGTCVNMFSDIITITAAFVSSTETKRSSPPRHGTQLAR